MPHVLPPDRVARVRRLLAAGHSIRETARQARVARDTVASIASGRHAQMVRDREARRRLEESLLPRGPFVWCAACGAKVQMPCVACEARRERKGRGPVHVSRVLRELAAASPALGLDLKPADRARYEKVKKTGTPSAVKRAPRISEDERDDAT